MGDGRSGDSGRRYIANMVDIEGQPATWYVIICDTLRPCSLIKESAKLACALKVLYRRTKSIRMHSS